MAAVPAEMVATVIMRVLAAVAAVLVVILAMAEMAVALLEELMGLAAVLVVGLPKLMAVASDFWAQALVVQQAYIPLALEALEELMEQLVEPLRLEDTEAVVVYSKLLVAQIMEMVAHKAQCVSSGPATPAHSHQLAQEIHNA